MLAASLKVMTTTERGTTRENRPGGRQWAKVRGQGAPPPGGRRDWAAALPWAGITRSLLFASLIMIMTSPAPDPAPTRVYRAAALYRTLLYVLLPPLGLAFLALPFWLMHGTSPSAWGTAVFLAMGLGLAAFVGYWLAETARARVSTGPQYVSQTNAFGTRALTLTEIAGYRTDDKYTRIYPTDPRRPTLRVAHTMERHAEIQQWLAARYPDLDRQETEQARAQLLADHDLGRTPEERADALQAAGNTARTLNIAGGVVTAWLLFYPHPYEWAMGAGLLLPVLAAAALWRSPSVLRVDEEKNSGYPSVFIALLGPGFGLLWRSLFDYELVSYAPLWPLVGAAAAGAALVLAIGSREFLLRRRSGLRVGLTIALLAGLYGYGATSAVNAAFDAAEAATFAAQVLSKHIDSGKHKTYHLKVTPWGPMTATDDVRVTREYYNQVVTGQTVTIALWPGRLGVPWYSVLESE